MTTTTRPCSWPITRPATRPSRPSVLATDILAGQRYEMGRLEQYLHDRGKDRPDPGRTVMAWMDEPVAFSQMPGLASRADLVAYLGSSGPQVDRRFLELMIAHRSGGVHMAEYAAEHAESADLRQLARLMVRQQRDRDQPVRAAARRPDASSAPTPEPDRSACSCGRPLSRTARHARRHSTP
ncbi:MAG: DUF305 domain-containing protein [Acidimicrobiales bacterium]